MRWIRHLIFVLAVGCHVSLASSCLDYFKKLSSLALDKTLLLGVAAGGAWAGSEGVGTLTHTPLIGLSIYFDYENILNFLSPEEKKILEAPDKQTDKIVEILNKHLSRQSGESLDVWPYLKPVMASQYFSDSPPRANMCRHKALILKAVLNHLGISAELRTGTVDSDDGRGEHVWVYLPESRKVADPMNNLLMNEPDYNQLFNPSLNWGIIHFAKPVGIMAR